MHNPRGDRILAAMSLSSLDRLERGQKIDYIPTETALEEGFHHGWRWAGAGSEQRIKDALRQVLPTGPR